MSVCVFESARIVLCHPMDFQTSPFFKTILYYFPPLSPPSSSSCHTNKTYTAFFKHFKNRRKSLQNEILSERNIIVISGFDFVFICRLASDCPLFIILEKYLVTKKSKVKKIFSQRQSQGQIRLGVLCVCVIFIFYPFVSIL